MLTRQQLDLPVFPSVARSDISGPSQTEKIAQLQAQASEHAERITQLLAALQRMWETLNAPGSISITNATTIQGPETSLLRQMLLVGA